MKQGDQVQTPSGVGIFFSYNDSNITQCYVRLKDPVDNVLWIPAIEPGHPIWETFPCNKFETKDISITKTLEQRQAEAQATVNAARAQQEAFMREKIKQHNEAQRKAHESNNKQKP